MHPRAGGGAADPLAVAVGQGRAALEAHGPLENGQGPAVAAAVQKGAVLAGRLLLPHARDHLQPRRPQPGQPVPRHPRIRIGESHHHPRQPRRDHRVTAGWRAAVVAAGLKGHHQGATPGPHSRLPQGAHLRVRLPGPGMEAFPHQRPRRVQHHGAHQGVGAGAALAQAGQLQGPLHPEAPGGRGGGVGVSGGGSGGCRGGGSGTGERGSVRARGAVRHDGASPSRQSGNCRHSATT